MLRRPGGQDVQRIAGFAAGQEHLLAAGRNIP
jgi:hypothetical protein